MVFFQYNDVLVVANSFVEFAQRISCCIIDFENECRAVVIGAECGNESMQRCLRIFPLGDATCVIHRQKNE